MKLLNELYSITQTECTDQEYNFRLHLNAEHFIYKAHFPGEPITPGVCIMQIAKELLEIATSSELELDTVKNIKFLNIISPDAVTDITYSISKVSEEQGCVKAQFVVSTADALYAKLSLVCRKTA